MRNLIAIVALSLLSCQTHERINQQLAKKSNSPDSPLYGESSVSKSKIDLFSSETTLVKKGQYLSVSSLSDLVSHSSSNLAIGDRDNP